MTDVDAPNGLTAKRTKRRAPKGVRVFGDLVAIVLNLVILWVLTNLLKWGWLSFLTDDFTQVLPLIQLQIAVTIVVHCFLIVRDPDWMRASGDVVTGSFGLVAVLAMWRVFPFDFDAGIWTAIARVAIGVGVVGTVISIPVNLVKAIRAQPR